MYKVFFKDRTVFLVNSFNKTQLAERDRLHNFTGKDDLVSEIENFISDEEITSLFIVSEDLAQLWETFNQLFVTINAGGGLVRNEEDKLLVIFRNGKWDLPKGKADGDEQIEQTALREVQEECGINNLTILFHILDTYHFYILKGIWVLKKTSWFKMSQKGDEKLIPQTKEGITDIRWVSRQELPDRLEGTYLSIKQVLEKAGYSLQSG